MKDNWYIVQAILRCALISEPTIALKHQIIRLADFYIANGQKEISNNIMEMLKPKSEIEQFKIVQS